MAQVDACAEQNPLESSLNGPPARSLSLYDPSLSRYSSSLPLSVSLLDILLLPLALPFLLTTFVCDLRCLRASPRASDRLSPCSARSPCDLASLDLAPAVPSSPVAA